VVQLHQELKIDIVALGSLSVATPNVMAIEIDNLIRVRLATKK